MRIGSRDMGKVSEVHPPHERKPTIERIGGPVGHNAAYRLGRVPADRRDDIGVEGHQRVRAAIAHQRLERSHCQAVIAVPLAFDLDAERNLASHVIE